MLLVAEYERTGSYSATAQHFGVHENTVKRWVERFTLTGDVLTASRERVSTVVTPAFLDVALKLVDEGYNLVYGVESWSDLLVCDGHRQKSSSTPKSTATGSRY